MFTQVRTLWRHMYSTCNPQESELFSTQLNGGTIPKHFYFLEKLENMRVLGRQPSQPVYTLPAFNALAS